MVSPTMVTAAFLSLVSLSPVPRYEPVILEEHPHDVAAFTQGLVWHQGILFETTGHYGQSVLRAVAPEDGRVLRQVELPTDVFGEGLARVDDELFVLTWREERVLVYDLASFRLLREHRYTGEGWGLCYDGTRLVMSNGTSTLQTFEPATFSPIGSLSVEQDGAPVDQLNELECIGGRVYANVWPTDRIVVIDGTTGRVQAEIHGTPLATRALAANPAIDVFNGIAAVPASETFYLTGKRWPVLYRVRFVIPQADRGSENARRKNVALPSHRSGCGCADRHPGSVWLMVMPLVARKRSRLHRGHGQSRASAS